MRSDDRNTDSNGRLANGTFGPKNKCAANNRRGHMLALRKALWDCVTPDDLVDVMGSLLAASKAGDVAATKVLFERLFGKVGADVDIPEDEGSDAEKRQQLLNRFANLSPETQAAVRERITERKSSPLSEKSNT